MSDRSIVLTDVQTKMSENIFAYSCISEHFNHFKFLPKKNLVTFLADWGFAIPQLGGHIRKECKLFMFYFGP